MEDRRHIWGREHSWEQESQCWCDPHLRGPVYLPKIRPEIYHRPWPGFLFHQFGEHGPQVLEPGPA